MRKVKFIVPIPSVDYYLAQALVQITNFRELGYEQDAVYPVIHWGEIPEHLKRMMDSPDIKAKFFPYLDERKDRSYQANMKPYLMGKYFEQFPEEKDNVYVYLDPDCVFTHPFDFKPFIEDEVWYGSDTASYTGEDYIKGKGVQLFYDFCDIAGLDPKLVEGKKGYEIGAQYITKNNTAELWYEIERTSTVAYNHAAANEHRYKPEGHEYPFQKWTSEMVYTQLIAIKHGIELKVSDKLQFAWANWRDTDWFKYPFFHNAGIATTTDKDHYCKIAYQSSPFRKDIPVSITSVSYRYMELVKRTEKYFPDVIWD